MTAASSLRARVPASSREPLTHTHTITSADWLFTAIDWVINTALAAVGFDAIIQKVEDAILAPLKLGDLGNLVTGIDTLVTLPALTMLEAKATALTQKITENINFDDVKLVRRVARRHRVAAACVPCVRCRVDTFLLKPRRVPQHAFGCGSRPTRRRASWRSRVKICERAEQSCCALLVPVRSDARFMHMDAMLRCLTQPFGSGI